MEIRRTGAGLLFLTEIDAILEARGTEEDKILATELRAAYPIEKTCSVSETPPFTETELVALDTDSFKKHGGESLTSNEKQLAEMRHILAPRRLFDPNIDALRNWDKLSRIVDRQYFILPNPYEEWDDSAKIFYVDEHSYDPSLTPIVAVLNLEFKSLYYAGFFKVLPINADAVRLLGRSTRSVRLKGGTPIREKEILEQARKNQPNE
jgi:hypothetical protein